MTDFPGALLAEHEPVEDTDVRYTPDPSVTARPSDVQEVLQRAVEEAYGLFVPEEWSFDESNFLVTVARRLSNIPTQHRRLVFTADGHTQWIGEDQNPEDVQAEMVRALPLVRGQIEFLLDGQVRFPTGAWHIVPVGDLGWVCSRSVRFGKRRHFVVGRNGRFERVQTGNFDHAESVLASLAGVPSE